MPTPLGDLHWSATARGAQPQTQGFSGSPRSRAGEACSWTGAGCLRGKRGSNLSGSEPPPSPGGACLILKEQPLVLMALGPLPQPWGRVADTEHGPQAEAVRDLRPSSGHAESKRSWWNEPRRPLQPETSTTLLGRHRSPPRPTQVTLHAHRQCSPATRCAREA